MIAAVISIIIIGLILIVLEFFVFPGTTFVGIIGVVFIIIGNYLCFQNYGNFYGIISLLLSAAIGITLFVVGLKSLKNSSFTLKKELHGRVNELTDLIVNVGDEGMTVSDLKPFGKAVFNDNDKIEVKSNNDFIDRNTKIKIIEINLNTILVTKLN